MRIVKTLFVPASLLLTVLVSPARAYEYEMIVLVDGKKELRLPAEVGEARSADTERRRMLRAREENRGRHLDKLRQTISDMEANGFAVSEDSRIAIYDKLIADLRRRQEAGAPPQSGSIVPGFRPAELTRKGFVRGRKLGRVSLSVVDGYSHELATAYEFQDLGVVIVEELSYATIPDTKIVVNKPIGNLQINGYPATYTAHRNRGGTRGFSSITYITESKLIRVTALTCITREDGPRFRRFVELASAVS